MSLGKGDLEQALYRYGRGVLLHAAVDTGATATRLPLAGGNFAAGQWVGRWVHVLTGQARGAWRRIASNDASSLTLESALPTAPLAGDEIAILEFGPISGTVTADQGAPGAQPWPVDVTDRSGRALGQVTAAQGAPGSQAWPVDWSRIRAATDYRVLARTALAAGASATIWTPAAGLRVRLLSLHVTTSAATVLTVRLGANVVWERDFAAAGGADVLLPLNGILGPVDGALSVTSSAAATVGATAIGTEE